MPRNVRNFWIEARIDGRDTKIAAGPVSKDGGFELKLYVRDEGSVTSALALRGFARPDGTLVIDGFLSTLGDDRKRIELLDDGYSFRINAKR